MKYSFFFILLCVLISCKSNKREIIKDKFLFFYSTTTQNFRRYNSDTFTIDKIKKSKINDTLLKQVSFEFQGKTHWINLFSNHKYAPIDGATLSFELDNLGVIYLKSTTWYSYGRLNCTNDSINSIINIALENIILHHEFHNIDLSKTNEKTITFKVPKI